MTGSEQTGLAALGRRVDALDQDVRNLRGEFDRYRQASESADRDMAVVMEKMDSKLDRHVAVEDQKYREQDRKMTDIQRSIVAMRDELKEPMEAWRTAKYGSKAAGFIASIARAVGPIVVAVIVGLGALQTKMLADIKTEIQPSATVNAGHAKGGDE
jgi:predicted  nucleic acid-binding Zn-ribbon protein